ncbi:MAG: Ig-like domain-containing protein [Longimicrobiales bacterium]|nr:Ig-like domain-containing protein [Longimicrobiales bacterium]
MTRVVAGALVTAAAAVACAQPGRPTGGPVDESPPRVIGVQPAAFDTLRDLRKPVIFQFDERISERLQDVTELREAVLVSPAAGVPLVDRGRREIEVRLAGGWEADRVYRVVVLPVFSDLFGNPRREPVELVFTTGAPIRETAIAGFVRDRVTAQPVSGARVEAVRRDDGEVHVAVTDTAGFFAIRYAPIGDYDVRAWIDQDRDREPDFFEAQDTAAPRLAAADTVVLELGLLPMDTTAARLARAEPVDSVTVRLVFDDYFAPGPVEGATRLYLLPDSVLVTDQGRLLHGALADSILAAEAAARDSAGAGAGSGDSLPAAPQPAARADLGTARDTVRAAPGQQQAAPARRAGTPGGPRLPSQTLIVVFPEPLIPDTTYQVQVEGLVNIRGLPGGGGTAPFRSPVPPPPDTTAAPDSAAAPADTAGAPPDTVTGGGGGR